MNSGTLATYFDHTILNPSATRDEVKTVCEEAMTYGFFSVCVNPVHVKWAKEKLSGSNVKICSVVGFPLGANTSETKAKEAVRAVEDGADEIDMVINVGALIENDVKTVETDIHAVVTAAKGKLIKVIIETCLLTTEQKISACLIAKQAGADFVKTSTGFSGGGATPEDVALMKKTIGSHLKVKASGGIKTREDALKMIQAGADRIGASAGVSIVKEKD